jgi:hypothetical protein
MAGTVQHGITDHKGADNSAVLEASRTSVHMNAVVVQEWPSDPYLSHTSKYTTPAYHPLADCIQDTSIALPAGVLPPALAGGSVA